MSDVISRIMAKIDIDSDTGCWNWTGYISGSGYPYMWIDGKNRRLNRVMCHNLGDGDMALHKCDNRSCLNPDHLYPGDSARNTLDRVSRGRSYHPTGELHPNSKLSRDEAIDVFILCSMGDAQGSVSDKVGVSQTQVSRIYLGRRWGEVRSLFSDVGWV